MLQIKIHTHIFSSLEIKIHIHISHHYRLKYTDSHFSSLQFTYSHFSPVTNNLTANTPHCLLQCWFSLLKTYNSKWQRWPWMTECEPVLKKISPSLSRFSLLVCHQLMISCGQWPERRARYAPDHCLCPPGNPPPPPPPPLGSVQAWRQPSSSAGQQTWAWNTPFQLTGPALYNYTCNVYI